MIVTEYGLADLRGLSPASGREGHRMLPPRLPGGTLGLLPAGYRGPADRPAHAAPTQRGPVVAPELPRLGEHAARVTQGHGPWPASRGSRPAGPARNGSRLAGRARDGRHLRRPKLTTSILTFRCSGTALACSHGVILPETASGGSPWKGAVIASLADRGSPSIRSIVFDRCRGSTSYKLAAACASRGAGAVGVTSTA